MYRAGFLSPRDREDIDASEGSSVLEFQKTGRQSGVHIHRTEGGSSMDMWQPERIRITGNSVVDAAEEPPRRPGASTAPL